MKYKFVAVYSVQGMTMHTGQDNVTLFDAEDIKVFLTANVTTPLAEVDREGAWRELSLRRMVGQSVGEEPKGAVTAHVADVLQKRHNRYPGASFLVIEVAGGIDVTLPMNCVPVDDYRICFGAYDKRALEEALYPHVASAMSAVRIGGEREYRFEQVAQGSHLIDQAGVVVYSLSFDITADGTISRALSQAQIASMRELIAPLRETLELSQAIDLYAQSLNRQETKLRTFMAAWNALELFVKKVKLTYGPLWLAERDNARTSAARSAELKAIPDKASEIAHAFGKIACYLGGATRLEDIAEFETLKGVRNDISHELKDKELPAERVHLLLDKYLKAHLKSVASEALPA
jgi:hypothetical protein